MVIFGRFELIQIGGAVRRLGILLCASVVWIAASDCATNEGNAASQGERVDGEARLDASIRDGESDSGTALNADGRRDPRYWPFSQNSPWNMPLGSLANYSPVSRITGSTIYGGINYGGAWTTAVAIASLNDKKATLYFNTNTFAFLSMSGKVCGNSPSSEAKLTSQASTTLFFEKNPYSTDPTSVYHDIHDHYSSEFFLPEGVCASPDTDAHLAIYQPDGWVLEAYNAIRLSNGNIVCQIGSYVDPTDEGTGAANGRKASMFPNFAGLIRTGELTSGRIPHALVATVPSSVLFAEAVWPALAYDTNNKYTGTVPMGSLLAIPAAVDVTKIGLSEVGVVVARAAQDYGVYVGDTGGEGITIQAELGNPDLAHVGVDDPTIIVRKLQRVTNNSATTRGGGGVPRAPLAPPF